MKRKMDKIESEIKNENYPAQVFARLMNEYRAAYIRDLKAAK